MRRAGGEERGRKPKYRDEAFQDAVRQLWKDMDHKCGRHIRSMIPEWLGFFEHEHGQLEASVHERLLVVSASTLERIIKPWRSAEARRRRCGTKPGSLIRIHVPIRTIFDDVDRPGFLEFDSVAHCGGSMSGQFAWSITGTDIETGWTENRAVWNRMSEDTKNQIRDIEALLPFALLAADSDGSEFLNWNLVKYFQERKQPVPFTRARSYEKNDNAHVEQKNWSMVRQYVGYERLDRWEVVDALNDVYRQEWSLYFNHFMPCEKLLSKERVGSKIVKRYDMPQTPYQRLLQSPHVSEEQKVRLRQLHVMLNPYQLKRAINRKLRLVFALNKAVA